jgi:hypothetical protein
MNDLSGFRTSEIESRPGRQVHAGGNYATAVTDAEPRTGEVSATTPDISNGRETHGNEGHDVTVLVAGRRMHGAKNNRVAARLTW